MNIFFFQVFVNAMKSHSIPLLQVNIFFCHVIHFNLTLYNVNIYNNKYYTNNNNIYEKR